MSCNCNKPKCDGKCGISPSVLQINNPGDCTLFHRVEVPASMGDSITNPPKNGDYRNVLLYYVADGTSWLFSSDGIPQKLVNGFTNYADAVNLPIINNVTLIGSKTGAELGLQDKLIAGDNIQIAADGKTISATDTTYTAGDNIQISDQNVISATDTTYGPATDDEIGLVKPGDGLSVEEDGTLNINDPVIKFHSVAASSATYIAEFPNGKNMIIDTGKSDEWSDIESAIDSLGIEKFDYVVITHFHSDHAGNIQNLIDNYDVRNAQWYIQMKPDYANHLSEIRDSEASYDNAVATITGNGITPSVPQNNVYIDIDSTNGIRMRFLNTSHDIAESYYGRYAEYYTSQQIGFNDFSLMCEIDYGNTRILATGDIERPVEDEYAKFLSKVNLMTAPHHGVNQDANRAFYYGTMPDYAICSYISTSDAWVNSWDKSFGYLKEVGAKIITAESSIPVNGLFSFISDGSVMSTNALYSGITDDVYNNMTMYEQIQSMIRFTNQSAATITLVEMLANLPMGASLSSMWYPDFDTRYAQAYSDLVAIFPMFRYGFVVEFRNDAYTYGVTIYNSSLKFEAWSSKSTISWNVNGSGTYTSQITTQTDLLSIISSLPNGHFAIDWFKDTNGDSGVLVTDGAYTLSINKTSSDTAMITGVLRNTDSASTDKTRAAFGYVNINNSPQINWHKVNNAE